MKTLQLASTIVAVLFTSAVAVAQELPAVTAPGEQHAWLKQFVGEWASESEATMSPGQPPVKCQGTMSSRMLGGFWVVSDVTSDFGGGAKVTAIQTIGYDSKTQKYIGTWVDSMMNHLWQYEGTVDSTGKILNLDAEGPNPMAEGKLSKYRDSYEFKSPDHIVLRSMMMGEDGRWIEFMTGQLRRKK